MTKQEFLAMSLPYGLKCMWFDGKISEVSMYAIPTAILENSKFILHPLSDFTKKIEHKGETFVPIEILDGKSSGIVGGRELAQMLFEADYAIWDIKYATLQKLLEWHFDIANLISEGEAIDVNTLDINPYK